MTCPIQQKRVPQDVKASSAFTTLLRPLMNVSVCRECRHEKLHLVISDAMYLTYCLGGCCSAGQLSVFAKGIAHYVIDYAQAGMRCCMLAQVE